MNSVANILPVTGKYAEEGEVLTCSPEDYEVLSKRKWNRKKDGYLCTRVEGKQWLIHRFLWVVLWNEDIPEKYSIDHINRNPLDNRRENLRIATGRQQALNRAVSIDRELPFCVLRRGNRFEVHIKIGSKRVSFGCAPTVEQAVVIRDEALAALEESEDAAFAVKKRYSLKTRRGSLLGVSKRGNKWRAERRINGKNRYLGMFDTPEEAREAFENAELE